MSDVLEISISHNTTHLEAYKDCIRKRFKKSQWGLLQACYTALRFEPSCTSLKDGGVRAHFPDSYDVELEKAAFQHKNVPHLGCFRNGEGYNASDIQGLYSEAWNAHERGEIEYIVKDKDHDSKGYYRLNNGLIPFLEWCQGQDIAQAGELLKYVLIQESDANLISRQDQRKQKTEDRNKRLKAKASEAYAQLNERRREHFTITKSHVATKLTSYPEFQNMNASSIERIIHKNDYLPK